MFVWRNNFFAAAGVIFAACLHLKGHSVQLCRVLLQLYTDIVKVAGGRYAYGGHQRSDFYKCRQRFESL
uniref:Putative secreted protein n=1 Tax=Anopheles marajoara TaxID=58244 RepID=A0A2M4CF97_9DIPT